MVESSFECHFRLDNVFFLNILLYHLVSCIRASILFREYNGNHSTTRVDKISSGELNIGAVSVVTGLHLIVNKIIYSSTVPDRGEKARLKSALKKGLMMGQNNLSMLIIPRKILDGLICRPLNNHLDLYELSTPVQWRFKNGKLTETENWREAPDRKQVIGILFMAFKKANESIINF